MSTEQSEIVDPLVGYQEFLPSQVQLDFGPQSSFCSLRTIVFDGFKGRYSKWRSTMNYEQLLAQTVRKLPFVT